MTITALDTLLSVLHDRGVINETGLEQVCTQLFQGDALTLDHLILIFGAADTYRCLTIPDEPARQLLREAIDLLTNPETTVDLRDWRRSAARVLETKA